MENEAKNKGDKESEQMLKDIQKTPDPPPKNSRPASKHGMLDSKSRQPMKSG